MDDFQCQLDSLLGFHSSGGLFCAVDFQEAANVIVDAIVPLSVCSDCAKRCLAVFLYTLLCPAARSNFVWMPELQLSERHSNKTEDVPLLAELANDERSVSHPFASLNLCPSTQQSSSVSRALRCHLPHLSPPLPPAVVAYPVPCSAWLSESLVIHRTF